MGVALVQSQLPIGQSASVLITRSDWSHVSAALRRQSRKFINRRRSAIFGRQTSSRRATPYQLSRTRTHVETSTDHPLRSSTVSPRGCAQISRGPSLSIHLPRINSPSDTTRWLPSPAHCFHGCKYLLFSVVNLCYLNGCPHWQLRRRASASTSPRFSTISGRASFVPFRRTRCPTRGRDIGKWQARRSRTLTTWSSARDVACPSVCTGFAHTA